MCPTQQLRSRLAISLQHNVDAFQRFCIHTAIHMHIHTYIHACVLFSQLHATFTLTIHCSFAARQAMQGMQLHFAYALNYAITHTHTHAYLLICKDVCMRLFTQVYTLSLEVVLLLLLSSAKLCCVDYSLAV